MMQIIIDGKVVCPIPSMRALAESLADPRSVVVRCLDCTDDGEPCEVCCGTGEVELLYAEFIELRRRNPVRICVPV